MVSMQQHGLLDKGEYYVVGVDVEQYKSHEPRRYFRGKQLNINFIVKSNSNEL